MNLDKRQPGNCRNAEAGPKPLSPRFPGGGGDHAKSPLLSGPVLVPGSSLDVLHG